MNSDDARRPPGCRARGPAAKGGVAGAASNASASAAPPREFPRAAPDAAAIAEVRANFSSRVHELDLRAGGSKLAAREHEYFRPTEVPASLRLLPGSLPFGQHFVSALNRSIVCSAGPAGTAPCIGCELERDGEEVRSSLPRATQVVAYGHGSGKTREACPGPGCRRCARGEALEADARVWEVSPRQQEELLKAEWRIGELCALCCAASVETQEVCCPHCGMLLLDRARAVGHDELRRAAEVIHRCPRCEQSAFGAEFVTCGGCGDDDARRADLYDVDITVHAEPLARRGRATALVVDTWSEPRPLDPRFSQVATPKDLRSIFAPLSYEQQQQMLEAAGVRRS